MRQHGFLLLISIVTLIASADIASAQLIQVGPGYVRAPLVRVYTYPDGSSYVRAPLVGIGSPGYRRGYYGGDGIENDFAALSWRQLGEAVREGATRLNADLDHAGSGNFWKGNLKTAEILALVPADRDNAPAADVRQKLRSILATYDTVSQGSDLNGVANYESFQMLHAALKEFTLPPAEHVGRQLRASANALYEDLRQFDTGDTWQRYLVVEAGLARTGGHHGDADALPTAAAAQDAIVRFDSVNQNPEYAKIAAVPTFRATREILEVYVHAPVPLAPKAEELPPPPKP